MLAAACLLLTALPDRGTNTLAAVTRDGLVLVDVPRGVRYRPNLPPGSYAWTEGAIIVGSQGPAFDLFRVTLPAADAVPLTDTPGRPEMMSGTSGAHFTYITEVNGEANLWVAGPDAPPQRIAAAPGIRGIPAPDGATVAFNTIDNTAHRLSTLHLASGTRRDLLEADFVNVAWSPDGAQLAVQAVRDHTETLWIARADGPAELVETFMWQGRGVWSPDGARFVFSAHSTEGDHLYAYDGTLRRVLPLANTAISLAFSPDGGTLALVLADPQTTQHQLLLIRDGTARPLLVSETQLANLAFSPDGRWIAYQDVASLYQRARVPRELTAVVRVADGHTIPLFRENASPLGWW